MRVLFSLNFADCRFENSENVDIFFGRGLEERSIPFMRQPLSLFRLTQQCKSWTLYFPSYPNVFMLTILSSVLTPSTVEYLFDLLPVMLDRKSLSISEDIPLVIVGNQTGSCPTRVQPGVGTRGKTHEWNASFFEDLCQRKYQRSPSFRIGNQRNCAKTKPAYKGTNKSYSLTTTERLCDLISSQ